MKMLLQAASIVIAASALAALDGQTTPATFDVASVKPNTSNNPPYANFPLGPGDVYIPNGGYFSARGFPLVTYIVFAYKVIGNQAQYLLPQLPNWTKTERYDIEARTDGNPGKDQMRLMMRSLLADRFQLRTHYEEREVPVFAFELAKAGKLGSQLKAHLDDPPCTTDAQPSSTVPTLPNGLPTLCNGIFPLPATIPGCLRIGARNVTLGFLADSLSAGSGLGRPMIDQTGLPGRFDFTLEFSRNVVQPAPGGPAASGNLMPPDTSGPTLAQALRDQLGIKLSAQRSSIHVLVLDHVERPTPN